jgi:hypothetical protein
VLAQRDVIGQAVRVPPVERQHFYEDLTGGLFARLLDYLNTLDAAHVHYALKHTRPDSVMIDVSLPGWRWEIEFMADGSVDVERYESVAGVEKDPALLDDLLTSE